MPAQSNSAKDLQRMSTRPTLVAPPSPDHGKAEIEHILELTQLNDIDPVCFPISPFISLYSLFSLHAFTNALSRISTQTPVLYGTLPELAASTAAQ